MMYYLIIHIKETDDNIINIMIPDWFNNTPGETGNDRRMSKQESKME